MADFSNVTNLLEQVNTLWDPIANMAIGILPILITFAILSLIMGIFGSIVMAIRGGFRIY